MFIQKRVQNRDVNQEGLVKKEGNLILTLQGQLNLNSTTGTFNEEFVFTHSCLMEVISSILTQKTALNWKCMLHAL